MNKFIIVGEVGRVNYWEKADKIYWEYLINTPKYTIPVIASAELMTDKHDYYAKITAGVLVCIEGVITSKMWGDRMYPSLFATQITILMRGGKK